MHEVTEESDSGVELDPANGTQRTVHTLACPSGGTLGIMSSDAMHRKAAWREPAATQLAKQLILLRVLRLDLSK